MADDAGTDDTQPPDFRVLAEANAKVYQDSFGVGGTVNWVINTLTKWVMVSIATVMKNASRMATGVLEVMKGVVEGADGVSGALAAFSLSFMFGGDLAATFDAASKTYSGTGEVSPAVGAAVLTAVFGPLQLDGGAELKPGVERAEGYLGAIASMLMRGFLLDIAEETLSLGQIQIIKNLEEELISGLGLGRIARRVLQPIVTTLVSEPALWAVNLAYRPKLMAEGTAIRQYMRGRLTDAELDDQLGRQGYGAEHIEALKNINAKFLSAGDLFTLVSHGVFSESDAIDVLKADGYEEDTAKSLFALESFRQLDALALRAANVWLGKYTSGLIEHDALVRSLSTLGLTDAVVQGLLVVGGAEREGRRKQLSEGQLIAAWKKSIITQNEAIEGLVSLGFSDHDAETLILTELAAVRSAEEAAQARKDAAAAKAAADAQKKADEAAQKAADKATAAAARQAQLVAAQAAKARIIADTEALQQFAAAATAQKQALVNAQHQAQLITSDAHAALLAQIDADHAALLASITAQQAHADVSFERQILDLQQKNREAIIQEQLDDVEIARIADTKERAAAVAGRDAERAAVLTDRLQMLDAIYTARAAAIDDDEAASLEAIQASVLPLISEREAAAQIQFQSLDDALARKSADLTDTYAEKHAAVEEQLANGDIKAPAADKAHILLRTAEADGQRILQQQHDLSMQRVRDVATIADPVPIDRATADQVKVKNAAAAARRKLANDRLAAELQAHQADNANGIRLQTIRQQIGPITDAEAARRRQAIQTAAHAAQRQAAITGAQIAKGEADAQATVDKAQASVTAARARVAAATAAAGARELAAAGAVAEQAALSDHLEQQRASLQAILDADKIAALPAA